MPTENPAFAKILEKLSDSQLLETYQLSADAEKERLSQLFSDLDAERYFYQELLLANIANFLVCSAPFTSHFGEEIYPRKEMIEVILKNAFGYQTEHAEYLSREILRHFFSDSLPQAWANLAFRFDFDIFATLDFVRQYMELSAETKARGTDMPDDGTEVSPYGLPIKEAWLDPNNFPSIIVDSKHWQLRPIEADSVPPLTATNIPPDVFWDAVNGLEDLDNL